MAGQPGFFDIDERYAALSAAGDPLERLAAVVDFEFFRPVLDAALARSSSDIGNPSGDDTENPATSATMMPRRMPVRGPSKDCSVAMMRS
ncbi:hypothetical protein ACFQX4_26005 [Roseomonas sp. GCM10028921]